jgi:tetratricopeptide (TPR) repeat protein
MNLARAAILIALAAASAARATDLDDALAALRRGDFQLAEQKLRAELRAHPNDSGALTLLGVALDNLKQPAAAADAHRRALAAAPNSPDVLNNYANHLLNSGDEPGAVKLYRRVIAVDSAHPNANLQLAMLLLKQGAGDGAKDRGQEALLCLSRFPSPQQGAPDLAIMRLEALYLSGSRAEAEALAAQLEPATRADLRLAFSAGVALAKAEQFEKAELFFNQALALAPADFNVLFNAGAVAANAGHRERALELLETALRQQPQNVDVLYQLALVNHSLNRPEAAIRLLAQATQIAPSRPDVLKLLAVSTADLGALEDSAAAWDRYLKLKPDDDPARRDRAFTLVRMGKFEEGIAGLRAFLAKHPNDPEGHYALGLALSKDDPAAGMTELDRALTLRPKFPEAHSSRGAIHYQLGKMDLAAADLEAAAALAPDGAATLDRLGQAYLALDRPTDAVRVLRHATELAPDDSKTILHFAHALADAGQTEESKRQMDRFRELGPVSKKGVPGGLVDYLSMTPGQRRADYRARLEKQLAAHPDNAAAQADYLKLLLTTGDAEQIHQAARKLGALKPKPALLADAGRALLESAQYQPAKALLQQAVAATSDPDAKLDLSLAVFHADGPDAGLVRLDAVPEAARGAAYFLERAQMLAAKQDYAGASQALDLALQRKGARAPLYRETASALTAANQLAETIRLLDSAVQAFPADRDLFLMRALTLELSGKTASAGQSLKDAQNRWPEWSAVWAARGIVLCTQAQFTEARSALETALALGADAPEVHYCLAESALQQGPASAGAADASIARALQLDPRDPWAQALAGRIAFAKGDYRAAIEKLREALRLNPSLIQAASLLAQAETAASGARPEASQIAPPSPPDAPPYLKKLLQEARWLTW